MTDDRVTLTVPARGEFAKAVRMAAATLVSRMGMTFDEVEDVRMAVDEAFVYAVDSAGGEGEVTITFRIGEAEFTMDVCLGHDEVESDEDAERRASLATFILDSVCDRYEFVSDENGVRSLRILKRTGIVDACC
jgi:hypothetical protein